MPRAGYVKPSDIVAKQRLLKQLRELLREAVTHG